MARLGLRWGTVAWIGLAASCVFATASCSSEDEPDNGQQPDAAPDTRTDSRNDVSVGTDVSSDGRTDTSVADTRSDTDGGTTTADVRPDTTPEGGNCVGGGDAARDGALGMMAVQALNCARCHQDEPVDAGLILSGKLTTIVADAGVFPKNLTPDPATGLGCWADDQITNAIMNGIDDQGQMLCSRMPMYKSMIDGGVAQQIVDFLRTVQAVHKDIPETTVCPPRAMPDAGPDSGDGASPDAGTDGGTTDGGTTDGGTTDAGPDTTTTDGGTDSATTDGGIDAGAGDAEIDVGTDGG